MAPATPTSFPSRWIFLSFLPSLPLPSIIKPINCTVSAGKLRMVTPGFCLPWIQQPATKWQRNFWRGMVGRSTSRWCFLSYSPSVLPWAVMLISSVPLGVHGLLVQLENGPCPCPQEPPASLNLKVGFYLCRASQQTCSRLASPAKQMGRGVRGPSRMQ